MAKHAVAAVGEIPRGGRKIAEIKGRSIGIFNVEGKFFAILNHCPHQSGPLCLGQVSGFVEANVPGEYHFTRRGEIIRCPWHGWEFDLKNGQSCIEPDHTRVRTYKVTVEGTNRDSSPVEGPYKAETYPVTIDDQYIFVEIS